MERLLIVDDDRELCELVAELLEGEGFRVVSGLSYADAHQLMNVFNNESCWMVSVDGAEANAKQWDMLEEILATEEEHADDLVDLLAAGQTRQ